MQTRCEDYRQEIEIATHDLLDEESQVPSQESLKTIARNFEMIGGEAVEATAELQQWGTPLRYGYALGPRSAANCMWDIQRSIAFLRGLNAAIREMQQRKPGKRIKILYAGCGPYAFLATPLCTQYRPDEIEFTIIDIHNITLKIAKKVIDCLGLQAFFPNVINCDAVKYKIHEDEKPDIIIVEAMDGGLIKEDQAALTARLAPRLAEKGIFLPVEIEIFTFLIEIYKFTLLDKGRGEITNLSTLLRVDKNFARGQNLDEALIVDARFRIPPLTMPNMLCLGTRIKVYRNHGIQPDASSANRTKEMRELSAAAYPRQAHLRYGLGIKTKSLLEIESIPRGKSSIFDLWHEIAGRRPL